MATIKSTIESIHGDSYSAFWTKRFPDLCADFLKGLLDEKMHLLAFSETVKIKEVHLTDSLKGSEHNDPIRYCLNRGLNLTQDLILKARLDACSGFQSIHLGTIPKQTEFGSFILNGKERFPIAQLLMSPGLMFSCEKVTRKHRYGDGVTPAMYYDVQWLLYKGKLIPSDGNWMEFELMKLDPKQDLSLLPLSLRIRLSEIDGQTRVRLRRKRWFSDAALLYALGIRDIAPTQSDEEDAWGLPAESEEAAYGKTRHLWREIASYLSIPTAHDPEDKIKDQIQNRLLTNNRLSSLARYQIDRRLNRLNWRNGHAPSDGLDHVTAQDIIGILNYLKALAEGSESLPLDSHRSLANKRVRLVGDLMEEEVAPRIFWKIRRRVNRRLMQKGHSGKRHNAEEWVQIFQEEVLPDNLVFQEIKKFFFEEQLSALALGQNPLEKQSLLRRITLFGPKGLPDTHVKDVRDIHWTHYGRLCPVDTPQSERLGATLSIPLEARVNERGLLETPVYEVQHVNGQSLVSQMVRWLSAADEEDEACCIAYYDQIAALEQSQKVWARKGPAEFQETDAKQVRYVDAEPLQQFSLAPRLIPFLQHDDANRVLMACSAMRQALPLGEKEHPLIQTGYESVLSDGEGNPWTYGRNLLVAYMLFRGLNFEDAVVVSESASRKLRSIRRYVYEIGLREFVDYEKKKVQGKDKDKYSPVTRRWELTPTPLRPEKTRRQLDNHGIVKEEAWVGPGDVLVGVEDPYQRTRASGRQLSTRSQEGKRINPWDHSLTVPPGEKGKVIKVETFCREKGDLLPSGIWKLVRVTVERELPMEVGDKLTNRHGGKGVVSAILKVEDMPLFMDPQSAHRHGALEPHTHVEVILNPLGVISRLNLGQLYETHLGWIAARTRQKQVRVESFTDSLKLLTEENSKVTDNPARDGKVTLYDPRTRKNLERPVTAGYAYLLRLHHLADEKVHGRGYARFKYSAMSEQPFQGKKRQGGQRLGEMEIWALEAYDARHILQEALTLKSDNPWMREWLYHAQKESLSIKGLRAQIPEMLRVLYQFLLALGLKLDFLDDNGKTLPALGTKGMENPDMIHSVVIRPLVGGEVKYLASGEVTDPGIGTEAEGYNDKGLLSQTIFGPLADWICKCGQPDPVPVGETERCKKCGVEIAKREIRRRNLGYIELAYPVFNVVFLDVASRLLGISRFRMKDMLKESPDAPNLSFHEDLDFYLFFWLAMNGSDEFRGRIEKLFERKCPEEQRSFQALKDMLGLNYPNRLSALPSREILEGLSAIELIGDALKALTHERLQEMRGHLINELESLKDRETNEARQKQLINRLDVVNLFLVSNIPPSSMMIKDLPVLPPDLRRPYGLLSGGEARGELNELYRDVIFVNNDIKVKKKGDKTKKELIRKLQQRVSALIDNDRAYPPSYNTATGRRYQQSLSYFIKGKKGFFRANLLGKRVDYSGRAVIVPDPGLHVNQCGLPYAMAVQIFMPILINRLREKWRPKGRPGKDKALSDRIVECRIRGTLRPIPAISIPGITVSPDDADKKEVTAALNAIGATHPILMNRQPTLHRLGIQAFFFRINNHNAVSMHPLVTAGFNADFDGDTIAIHRLVTQEALDEAKRLMAGSNLVSPASGAVTLNLGLDVALGAYLQTMTKAGQDAFLNGTGFPVKCPPYDSRAFASYVKRPLVYYDINERAKVVNCINVLCFEKPTEAGITLSIFDMPDLSKKRDGLKSAKNAAKLMDQIIKGLLKTTKESPLWLIHRSGAKGDIKTIRQLIAMRGEMERIVEEGGKVASSIVWSSLREGMSQGEYFVSSYGSRTTLVDKKMGTADAGYVTRQLVEMMQKYRITCYDCAAHGGDNPEGIEIGPYRYVWLDLKDWQEDSLIKKLHTEGHHVSELLWDIRNQQTDKTYEWEKMDRGMDQEVEESIRKKDPPKRLLGVKVREERSLKELVGKLYGRTLVTPVEIGEEGEKEGFVVDREEYALQLARQVVQEKRSFEVRSPLTCLDPNGLCQKCYGLELSTGKPPEIGAKVGIIAAQSIGEPGTQLVLRTFHSGGVMGMAGISKDIPKVQRFLNANSLAQLEASPDFNSNADLDSTKDYPLLVDAIKSFYLANGAEVADPHFEILIKAMLSKVEVMKTLSDVFSGEILDKAVLKAMNGLKPYVRSVLSGINLFTKYPTSWMAAASFGRALTTLAYAAVGGQKDTLEGLKENVILGKMIS